MSSPLVSEDGRCSDPRYRSSDDLSLREVLKKLDRLAIAIFEDEPRLANGLASLAHGLEAAVPSVPDNCPVAMIRLVVAT